MKKIVLILLFTFSFSACEKDDICDPKTTETTPKLVFQFYEIINPTIPRIVSDLEIIADGLTAKITYAAGSKILVPLKVNSNTVTYRFIQNSATISATDNNTDIITINYTTKNTFVSRACGYKTTFVLNDVNGVVLTDTSPNDNLWMRETVVKTTNIKNENEIHVKILF